MKKDIPLIMERIVFTYTVILIAIFVLKIIGLDYFGITMSNPFVIFVDKIAHHPIILNIIYLILILTYQFIMTSIICDKKTTKLTLYSIPFTFLFHCHIKNILMLYNLNVAGEILYLFILCSIYNKFCKSNIIRFIKYVFIMFLLQFISVATRYKYSITCIDSPTIDIILNLDYLFMLLLWYKLYFMKGEFKLCGEYHRAVGSFLPKLISLKKQLKKFQTKFLKSSKKEKFEFSLFFVLMLVWNIFTIFVVLFVAFLNNTCIECIFILSSFWINKTIFGKAFHLKNALHCFIVSNLTYYCLNRITTPISVSIAIPIILGILLCYITSNLTQKDFKPLYKGMSENELKNKLGKITNNELDYKICKLYYVDRFSELKVAIMTNYSVENIKKRKKNINDKLKGLFI